MHWRSVKTLILVAAGVEIMVAVLLGLVAYQVRLAMRQSAMASFRTNLVINKIAARAAELAQPKSATMLFVGDIMLARGVEFYTEREGNGDWRFPFLHVSAKLRAADLTIGNLENPISERGKNQGSIYSFRAKPESIEGLSYAGFDVLSLANNHMWDYGADALVDTVSLLSDARIQGVGAGENEKNANAPAIAVVGGYDIAFVSWTNLYPEGLEARGDVPGISRFRENEAVMKIRELSEIYDTVVVLFHWGEEYQTSANEAQRRIGRALIDAGTDLVVGHHPHVVQEVERYGSGWIAYSLGNFVFDQFFSEATMQGLALRVTTERGAVTDVESIPVRLREYFQPEIEGL